MPTKLENLWNSKHEDYETDELDKAIVIPLDDAEGFYASARAIRGNKYHESFVGDGEYVVRMNSALYDKADRESKSVEWRSPRFASGAEFGMEFEVFFDYDKLPRHGEKWLFTQVHGAPDDGEDYRNPPFSLTMLGDELTAWIRADSKPMTGEKEKNGRKVHVYTLQQRHIIGKIAGGWNTFKYMVKHDWQDDGDGYAKLWINGEVALDYIGPFGYNDEKGKDIGFGPYTREPKGESGIWEMAFRDVTVFTGPIRDKQVEPKPEEPQPIPCVTVELGGRRLMICDMGASVDG